MKKANSRISRQRSQLAASITSLEKKVADQKKKLAALDEAEPSSDDKRSGSGSTGKARKKTAKKAAASKGASAKKGAAKKSAVRKSVATNSTAKRTGKSATVKKAATGKAAASKKSVTKKAVTNKPVSRKATRKKTADNGKPGMYEAIRETLRRNRGPMGVSAIIAAVDGKTRSVPTDLPRAVAATLSNLVKAGSIERVSVGQYALK